MFKNDETKLQGQTSTFQTAKVTTEKIKNVCQNLVFQEQWTAAQHQWIKWAYCAKYDKLVKAVVKIMF